MLIMPRRKSGENIKIFLPAVYVVFTIKSDIIIKVAFILMKNI